MPRKPGYFGITGPTNSVLPFIESVAEMYGGRFNIEKMKFDFSDNPEGLEEMKKDYDNAEWINRFIKE